MTVRCWVRRVLTMLVVVGLVAGCGDDGSGPAATGTTVADNTSTSAPAPAGFTEAVVERGTDGSLTVSWGYEGASDPVEVRWGNDPDTVTTTITTVNDASTATFADPAPGARAYFILSTGDDTITVAERRVVLEGTPNFRDLGGYETEDGRRVRWGQIFRSGELSDLTPADLAIIENIGIKLVCDLRTQGEIDESPDAALTAASIHVDVNDPDADVQAIINAILAGELSTLSGDMLLDSMPTLATDFPTGWKTLVDRVADPANRPTNVHCTSGKDRAGWASALLLRALGVPEDVVMEDYLLSVEFLEDRNAETVARVRTLVAGVNKVPEDQVDTSGLIALLEVEPEYLQAAFDAVDAKFGTFAAYLTDGLGLTEAEIATLRDQLLE